MPLLDAATASLFCTLLFGARTALIDFAAGSALLFLGRPRGFLYRAMLISISATNITAHLLLTMCSYFELLLMWRLGCTNLARRKLCNTLSSTSLPVGFKTGMWPATALFITSGLGPPTYATIASLLSGVYPLGRSPCCRLLRAMVMVRWRLGMYCPSPFKLGTDLVFWKRSAYLGFI